MNYLVGVILGIVVGGFATLTGLDRDRAFYPTVLIVIASYYGLFAVMGAPPFGPLIAEVAVGLVFLAFAMAGFRLSLWIAAAGIAGHAAFDFLLHESLIANPGMPQWWPGFCGTIDLVIAGWLAVVLWTRQRRAPGIAWSYPTSSPRNPRSISATDFSTP